MSQSPSVDRDEIEQRLQAVGEELQRTGVTGEIVIVGGAFIACPRSAAQAEDALPSRGSYSMRMLHDELPAGFGARCA